MSSLTLQAGARFVGAACLLASIASTGCDDENKTKAHPGLPADAGVEPYPMDAGGDDAGQVEDGGESKPDKVGPLEINTTPDKQTLDLFGVSGHRLWFDMDKEQLELLNGDQGGGFPGGEDIYTPGTGGTYADHLAVQDKTTGSVADYGKTEVKLVGESTRRPWSNSSIPNLRIDMDEFASDQTLGGVEHFRLNNGQVGSIFREALAHRIYRELDYPALRASHAFLGSSVWGKKTWVPMILIEVYKLPFCEVNKTRLGGGGCTNIWEFPGDVGGGGGGGGGINWGPIIKGGGEQINIGGGGDVGGGIAGGGMGGEPPPGDLLGWLPSNACQLKSCDNQKLADLTSALATAPVGAGFKQALDPIIDWQRYHEFQCLSWILWTGDDALHNTNNNLIIEQSNGKLMWAPYSVDISAGQSWYVNTPLPGTSGIAQRCQADAECWADTISVCEDMITKFDTLDPERFVDETKATLTTLGMMRDGDEGRAKEIRDWYVWRQTVLSEELERYRYLPGPDGCPNDLTLCPDNTCGTELECGDRLCGGGQVWCETFGRCISPQFENCPLCPKDAPLYCAAADQCVSDWATCDAVCDAQQPGTVYCVAQGYCTSELDCKGGGMFDGGVFPVGDAGVKPGDGDPGIDAGI